jgi:hypothetical protein
MDLSKDCYLQVFDLPNAYGVMFLYCQLINIDILARHQCSM